MQSRKCGNGKSDGANDNLFVNGRSLERNKVNVTVTLADLETNHLPTSLFVTFFRSKGLCHMERQYLFPLLEKWVTGLL